MHDVMFANFVLNQSYRHVCESGVFAQKKAVECCRDFYPQNVKAVPPTTVYRSAIKLYNHQQQKLQTIRGRGVLNVAKITQIDRLSQMYSNTNTGFFRTQRTLQTQFFHRDTLFKTFFWRGASE